MATTLAPSRERRSGLRPLHSVGEKLFVEDDQGRPVEVRLFVGGNGIVTARAATDTGIDQARVPQRHFLDAIAASTIDQA